MCPAVRTLDLTLPLVFCMQGATWAASPGICDLAEKRGGLVKYAVVVEPDENGDRVIAADIDGDGSADKITWFDPGSGSIIPADSSTLTLTLSSSGNRFMVQEQRLDVVKFQKKYFVITGWLESEQGPWHSAVHALTGKGIEEVCSFSGKGLGP